MANDIEVNIDLAIKQASKDINKLSKRLDNFEKDVKKNVSAANSAFKVFAGTLGALGVAKAFGTATRAAGRFFKALVVDGIEAAKIQEEAVNSMEVALGRFGERTTKASSDIQAWASSLQVATGIGDETTLELFALSAAFTDNSKKAKLATEAAIELSTVADISLQEATRRVGRAFSGSTEDISKFAKSIRGMNKDQLAAGDAAQALIDALGGAAAAKLDTFAGAADAARGDFADFTEEIGFLVIKNKGFVNAMNLGRKVIRKWGAEIENNSGRIRGFINSGIVKLIDAIDPLLGAVDFMARGFRIAWNGITAVGRTAVASILGRLGFLVNGLLFAAEKAASVMGDKGLAGAFKGARDGYNETVGELANEVKQDFDDIADAVGGESTISKLRERALLAAQAVKQGFIEGGTAEAPSEVPSGEDPNEEKNQAEKQGFLDALFFGQKIEKKKTLNAKEEQALRIKNTKASLATIATLADSNNKVLAAAGKAAAISTATIDGIAATQKALASAPPPFNFALAGLVGAAAAANVAKIAGVGFQDGGVVGGTSFTGDNVPIRVNSGELVLTREQQANLFQAANVGGGGGGGTTVNINIDGNVIPNDETWVAGLVAEITDAVKFDNAQLTATGTL